MAVLTFGDIAFDPRTSILTGPGREERLTPLQAVFLDRMMRTPEQVVTPDMLFHYLYPMRRTRLRESQSCVRVLLVALRKKLQGAGCTTTIRSVRCEGYRLQECVEAGRVFFVPFEHVSAVAALLGAVGAQAAAA